MEWLIFIIGIIAFSCIEIADMNKPKKKWKGHYSARSSQLRARYTIKKLGRMKF